MTEMQTRPTQKAPAVVPEFDLADRIRKAMRIAGYDYRELAERIEVSKSSIGNWVNGVTTPRRRDLRLLAEACGVDLEWLMFGYAGKEGLNRSTGR
ncbi:helix-turn-helix domain-containing protein [Jiangella gansuensis]|uniref:helix-turn-helix domain-containing protein n=1 Tax=Jiangella gansuensis TaxID=281473 RepID=UPI000567019C|nr:helix-turn-helix transcriptional regulator [Jiangella gansuensis]